MKLMLAQKLRSVSELSFKINLQILLPPLFVFILFFAWLNLSFAQGNKESESLKTQVSASVGEFYLNLSGYITPFASIVLTSDNIFLRATVSDENGDFIISHVLIKKGFSDFCLDAIDFKRIGESYTCFHVPPAKEDITMRDIFLPPTLGLEKDTIAENGFTYAYGYSMPGAFVTLHLSNGNNLKGYADNTGYYRFVVKNLKAGNYTLFATAEYNQKQSLSPSKKLNLKSLSLWDQFWEFIKKLWAYLVTLLTSISLGPLWLIIPILILIFILILKIWPERFTSIYKSRIVLFVEKRLSKDKHPLHHLWWMGY